MTDGGILAVRPETELKVDTYRFAGKEDGTERRGHVAREGRLSHHHRVSSAAPTSRTTPINTPTAMIGIRGTDHEPHVIPAAASGGDPPCRPARTTR